MKPEIKVETHELKENYYTLIAAVLGEVNPERAISLMEEGSSQSIKGRKGYYTKAMLVARFFVLWEELGRQPMLRDWEKSGVSIHPIRRYWLKWSRFVEAALGEEDNPDVL